MVCKILINPNVKKQISSLFKNEKVHVVKALDMMESIGQMGEILFHDLNIWRYRTGNIRIIYRKKSDQLIILSILKGFNQKLEFASI